MEIAWMRVLLAEDEPEMEAALGAVLKRRDSDCQSPHPGANGDQAKARLLAKPRKPV
jgi:DNA-binding response OmpR family regulator